MYKISLNEDKHDTSLIVKLMSIWNNPTRVDMPIKAINKPIHYTKHPYLAHPILLFWKKEKTQIMNSYSERKEEWSEKEAK